MDIVSLLLFYHIVPTILGSALTLIRVLLFMKIFFIKRPTVRYVLLCIPLVKPLTMLIGGFSPPDLNRTGWLTPYLSLGSQMPDPFKLIDPSVEKESIYRLADGRMATPETTELFLSVATLIGIAVFAIILIRWMALLSFRRRLAAHEEIDHARYSDAFHIVENLSQKFGVSAPRLIFADISSPIMVGIKNCTVALPRESFEEMSRDEVEGMLAHEIAHIKRKDNLRLWFAIICRDLMFFNPFAWITFRLLMIENERAGDYLAAKITGKPFELANSITKIAEKLIVIPCPRPTLLVLKSDLWQGASLKRRVDDLLHFKHRKRIILRLVPLTFLFFILFYLRSWVHIKLPGNYIFSFFG